MPKSMVRKVCFERKSLAIVYCKSFLSFISLYNIERINGYLIVLNEFCSLTLNHHLSYSRNVFATKFYIQNF